MLALLPLASLPSPGWTEVCLHDIVVEAGEQEGVPAQQGHPILVSELYELQRHRDLDASHGQIATATEFVEVKQGVAVLDGDDVLRRDDDRPGHGRADHCEAVRDAEVRDVAEDDGAAGTVQLEHVILAEALDVEWCSELEVLIVAERGGWSANVDVQRAWDDRASGANGFDSWTGRSREYFEKGV